MIVNNFEKFFFFLILNIFVRPKRVKMMMLVRMTVTMMRVMVTLLTGLLSSC